MCTFLAYKGPEVDRPGLVTCANEHFFPKSLGNLAYSTSDKAFFCYLITNQSPVVTRQTRTAVYCMQIPGKMEGGCSISVKWNIHWDPIEIPGKFFVFCCWEVKTKKIFQQLSLSVWSWGQDIERGFSLTANPAVVLYGQVSRRVPSSALGIWQCWTRESSCFTPPAMGCGAGRRGSTDQ